MQYEYKKENLELREIIWDHPSGGERTREMLTPVQTLLRKVRTYLR